MPENTPLEAHKDIKLFNTEDWLYEDFEIGLKSRSISRTISEGKAVMFNGLGLDIHPYVADQTFAKEKGLFWEKTGGWSHGF